MLHFTSQSLSMYAWKSSAWSEELFAVWLLPFLHQIPHVVSNPGFPQSLLVSKNFFTCFLHSFLHCILPFCGTRCSDGKSSKSVPENCLKSQLSGWVLKLTCIEPPDCLIALLVSFHLDLYFCNDQSVVTSDINSTADSCILYVGLKDGSY